MNSRKIHQKIIKLPITNKNLPRLNRTGLSCGDPKENRTPDSALRGRRLDRLTIGP